MIPLNINNNSLLSNLTFQNNLNKPANGSLGIGSSLNLPTGGLLNDNIIANPFLFPETPHDRLADASGSQGGDFTMLSETNHGNRILIGSELSGRKLISSIRHIPDEYPGQDRVIHMNWSEPEPGFNTFYQGTNSDGSNVTGTVDVTKPPQLKGGVFEYSDATVVFEGVGIGDRGSIYAYPHVYSNKQPTAQGQPTAHTQSNDYLFDVETLYDGAAVIADVTDYPFNLQILAPGWNSEPELGNYGEIANIETPRAGDESSETDTIMNVWSPMSNKSLVTEYENGATVDPDPSSLDSHATTYDYNKTNTSLTDIDYTHATTIQDLTHTTLPVENTPTLPVENTPTLPVENTLDWTDSAWWKTPVPAIDDFFDSLSEHW